MQSFVWRLCPLLHRKKAARLPSVWSGVKNARWNKALCSAEVCWATMSRAAKWPLTRKAQRLYALSSISLSMRAKERTSSPVSFVRKVSALCGSRNGATRLFCEWYAMRNTAATWCRKRPIRPTSYLTKRNTTVVKRNLLSLKTITSRLFPVNCSMKQTVF